MDEDRIAGTAKDLAGKVERTVGTWLEMRTARQQSAAASDCDACARQSVWFTADRSGIAWYGLCY